MKLEIILSIPGLFNNTVAGLDSISVDGLTISNSESIWKWSWLILRYYPGIGSDWGKPRNHYFRYRLDSIIFLDKLIVAKFLMSQNILKNLSFSYRTVKFPPVGP